MFRFIPSMKLAAVIMLLPLAIGKSIPNKSRLTVPHVPDTVYPSVPDSVKINLSDDEREELASSSDPEVRPALFEGDMALSSEAYNYWRVGLRWDVFPERLWKNRTVPYVISPLYDPTDHVTIYTALETLNFMTCVKFVPWNGRKKDFLLIWPIKFPKGCWSFVGRTGGAQIVSLQPPDRHGPNCLGGTGRAIHELMHAIGIFHEQSRADRDKFVKVHFDNIIPQFVNNFDKQSLKNTTYSYEYDYDSIMHYGEYFFSKGEGLQTLTAKHQGARLGQRKALSKTDCLKINELYGCLKKSEADSIRYYTICNSLGI